MAPVGEDDGGDRPSAVLQLFDEAQGLGVFGDVKPVVSDSLFTQELLGPLAVRAPGSPVDLYICYGRPPFCSR